MAKPKKPKDPKQGPKDPKGPKEGNKLVAPVLAAVSTPEFWKIVGKAVLKLNHPSWYGGDSNSFQAAVGPFAKVETVGSAIFMANTHISVGVHELIEYDIADSQVSSLIAAYNKFIGFETGLTITHVKNYQKATLNYLASFATLKRFLNYLELPIVSSWKLGDKFGYQIPYSIIRDPEAPEYAQGFYGNKVQRLPNVSNYVWNTKYVAALQSMRLLPHQVEFVQYLFDNVFSNGIDSGVNSIIEFIPKGFSVIDEARSNVYREVDYQAALDAALAEVNSVRSSNIYLEDFISLLGFKTQDLYEWGQRSATATDYSVVVDPTMNIALSNMFNQLAVTKGLILDHSPDIDIVFDRKTELLPIGDIMSMLKLAIMYARVDSTYSLMKRQTGNITWNTAQDGELASPSGSEIGSFHVVPVIKEINTNGALTGLTAKTALEYADKLAYQAKLNIYEYMGVEDPSMEYGVLTIDNKNQWGIYRSDAGKETYTGGSDFLVVNNIDEVLKVGKQNFALGINYAKHVQEAINEINKTLMVK